MSSIFPGIKKGIVAIPSRFTVDTKNAGPGDLSVAVEGPSKVDIECIDNGDGTCEVTYVPVEPGNSLASFFTSRLFRPHSGAHISEWPLSCKIL